MVVWLIEPSTIDWTLIQFNSLNWIGIELNRHWIGPYNSPTAKSVDWLSISIETHPLFFFLTTHTMGPMLGPIPPLKWGHQCDPNGLFVGWSHLHRFINWNTFFFSSKTHTMGPTFICPIQSLKWGHQCDHEWPLYRIKPSTKGVDEIEPRFRWKNPNSVSHEWPFHEAP